jgi:hypothetical protein
MAGNPAEYRQNRIKSDDKITSFGRTFWAIIVAIVLIVIVVAVIVNVGGLLSFYSAPVLAYVALWCITIGIGVILFGLFLKKTKRPNKPYVPKNSRNQAQNTKTKPYKIHSMS